MSGSKLRNNIVALFILQGANYILPLITLPYLLRVLGPENFGRVGFAQAFIAYFIVLTDYGFNLSATRTVAQIRSDKDLLSRFVSTVIVIKSVLMLFGFLAMLAIIWSVPEWREDWALYSLAYLSVLGGVLFPVWLFQGIEQMRYITILSISARVLVVIAIFTLVQQSSDYRLAATIQALSGVASGLLALMILPRLVSLHWVWPEMADIRHAVKDGWHLFVSNVAINLYTSSNIFFLGLLANPTVVGYFSAAEKLVKAIQGLVGPVSQAVYPLVAALKARSPESALDFIVKLLTFQSAATLAISIGLFLLAGPIVHLLFGTTYEPSIALLQWMAPLPFLIGISNVFGIHTMLNFDMKAWFSLIVSISGLLNILLIFLLVPSLGAKGSAISVLLTETTVMALMAISLWRRGLLMKILRRKESNQ